ncbi:MAG: DNA polymerase III subunit epsilon, partial [Rubrivivax sp.]|nr:DNA polymerase III subunit epsilon [Rubrivivax sp.]
MRQIFLDTETTGLSAESGDRIIEIGCLEMVNRRMTGNNLHHYLNPQRSSHPDAVKVHGLTDEFLADKPLFAQIAQELAAYLSGAELIIHNAAFDTGFLDAEFRRLDLPPTRQLAAKVTDSLTLAREMFPGKSNSLDALCRRLEVDNKHRNFHGALLDAGLLAEVYIRLTRGQDSLVIEEGSGGTGLAQTQHEAIDLRGFVLPVIAPT